MKTTVLALLALASSAVSAPNPRFDINRVSAREVETLENRSICSLEDIILLLLPSKDKQSASAFRSGYLQQTLTTTSTSSIVTTDTFFGHFNLDYSYYHNHDHNGSRGSVYVRLRRWNPRICKRSR
jgi:hypothetical protein